MRQQEFRNTVQTQKLEVVKESQDDVTPGEERAMFLKSIRPLQQQQQPLFVSDRTQVMILLNVIFFASYQSVLSLLLYI